MTLLDYVGPEMSFGQRLLFANRWLFDPVLRRALAGCSRDGRDASYHDGRDDDPGRRSKTTCCRLTPRLPSTSGSSPGETVESVRERVTNLIDDDRIEVRTWESARDPSALSDPEGARLSSDGPDDPRDHSRGCPGRTLPRDGRYRRQVLLRTLGQRVPVSARRDRGG